VVLTTRRYPTVPAQTPPSRMSSATGGHRRRPAETVTTVELLERVEDWVPESD